MHYPVHLTFWGSVLSGSQCVDPCHFGLSHSKQRHNKLWRPDPDSELTEGQAASLPDEPEDVTPEPGSEAWGGEGAGVSPCRTVGLEVDPSDPPNYNYYFRRLSDSALDSDPSTPVRAAPLLEAERVFIAIEDVERDALLDDGGFEARECPLAHLALPGEGTAAQTYGRPEPLEELRLRLEFSTVEEEDEEEAQKEEAEMEALQEAMSEEEARLCSASLLGQLNRFNGNSNNNNNGPGAKRSFDVSGRLCLLTTP